MTCFSCTRVLNITNCADPGFAGIHFPNCQRETQISSGQEPGDFIPLRLLPFGIAQATLLTSSFILFSLTWESRAHIFYAFLILTTGINLSCLTAVRKLGSSMASILKGLVNFFFPLFLPRQGKGRALFLQLLLTSLTSTSLCLVTSYFHRRGNRHVQDYVRFTGGHWAQLLFNFVLVVAFVAHGPTDATK